MDKWISAKQGSLTSATYNQQKQRRDTIIENNPREKKKGPTNKKTNKKVSDPTLNILEIARPNPARHLPFHQPSTDQQNKGEKGEIFSRSS